MNPEPSRTDASPRLLLVGAGALGNALLPRIIRWPWYGITLMDGDRVEGKNLEGQELFAPVDVGKPKVEVAAAWLRNAPIATQVNAHDAFIDAGNAEAIIAMHDVVADCTDDAHAKRLLDRVCAEFGVALVSGSVHGAQAQVMVLHAQGKGEAITRGELFRGKPGLEQDGCDMRLVPMATIEETGRRMAQLLRALVNGQPVVNGRIDLYDGRHWVAIDPPDH
jgi:molybdopterin/thiamine biosynthesis adenylyltransferase